MKKTYMLTLTLISKRAKKKQQSLVSLNCYDPVMMIEYFLNGILTRKDLEETMFDILSFIFFECFVEQTQLHFHGGTRRKGLKLDWISKNPQRNHIEIYLKKLNKKR